MISYRYRKSRCWDKTIVRSSYLHNGISYTGKMASLYWIRALALFATRDAVLCLKSRITWLFVQKIVQARKSKLRITEESSGGGGFPHKGLVMQNSARVRESHYMFVYGTNWQGRRVYGMMYSFLYFMHHWLPCIQHINQPRETCSYKSGCFCYSANFLFYWLSKCYFTLYNNIWLNNSQNSDIPTYSEKWLWKWYRLRCKNAIVKMIFTLYNNITISD